MATTREEMVFPPCIFMAVLLNTSKAPVNPCVLAVFVEDSYKSFTLLSLQRADTRCVAAVAALSIATLFVCINCWFPLFTAWTRPRG